MFRISKESIRHLATDEATYFRGLRYYKENAVSNVTWSKTSKQYRAVVQGGNQYLVTISEDKDGEIQYSCNCPAHIKYKGACKHVVAALLFIANYMERNDIKKPVTEEEKNLYHIIDYFNNQYKAPLIGETFHAEVTIHFPEILKGNDSKVYLSLRVGSSKLYKIQNIKKFLHGLLNQENIILGKEFKFIAGESRFSKGTKPIMEYLKEIYEIQEALGKVYYNNLFNRTEMVLTGNMLYQLLHNIGSEEFCIGIGGEFYQGLSFLEKNPPIAFQVESDEESIRISMQDDTNQVRPLAENGSLLLYKNVLYKPEKDFTANYLPFFNSFRKNNEELNFSGDLKEKFIEAVLPKIHETMEINVPESLQDKYINEDLQIKIYLDKYANDIKAMVLFQYGAYEINPLLNNVPSGIILIRKKEKESEFFDYMDQLRFEPYKEFFLLKRDNDIYDFLNQSIFEMNEKYQVFHSDEMKYFKAGLSSNMVRTSVGFNEKIKLLELTIGYDAVPKSELKDFFKSLQLKKKYHRLKDGRFVTLSGDGIAQIERLLDQLDIGNEHIDVEGNVTLPGYMAMYLDQIMTGYDRIEYKKNHSYKELLENILKPKHMEIQVPEMVHAVLRPYQVIGFKWLYALASNHLGGILADDMGLGKTLQTITYICFCLESDPKGLFLVVAPTSLVFNWQEEFEKFAPSVKTKVVEGSPEERIRQIKSASDFHVIISSYPLLRRDVECYEAYEFHTMFIDEGQFVKNPQSQNAKSVKLIRAKHKFALTGTPIENSLSELWSLFDFIMPNYLYNHNRFTEKFERPIMKDSNKAVLDDLGKHIEPFILRRMKQDVLQELPDKIESKMMAEMTSEQAKIYQSCLLNVKQELALEISKNGVEKSHIQILAALTRLRQICCHPSTFIEDYEGGSGKLELLMQVVSDILENGHRILIFSQFTSMLGLISKELEKQEMEYFYLSGSTKVKDRKDFVDKFNAGERSVFLISLKAGGTGLNLVGADVVIHYDPWWNPAVEEQATDRVYRIGQKKSVQVIRLLTKNTIEEKIDKLQKRKKQLSDSVIKSKEVFISQLSRKELEELFL